MRPFTPPALAALAVLLGLGACAQTEYGVSAAYSTEAVDPPAVTVPANAPSIFQQFRRLTHDNEARGKEGDHIGIDIRGPKGFPILAAAPGVVVKSYFEPGYGQRVEIDHAPDAKGRVYRTRYLHLSSRDVTEGDHVARGQQIGGMGNSGTFSGGLTHLHFELFLKWDNGWIEPTDPNLRWYDGVGRVTCFDPARQSAGTGAGFTYPVPCR
ncbi:M23 family metallopeptidase [Shimia biformata]|uniref:M23 family metallopeptidase n=1 Tax=Shimia biformata TaxID=1294299 RepID=UPI0019513714|nr:M23 family metallopeptidase [Shimia biformata]